MNELKIGGIYKIKGLILKLISFGDSLDIGVFQILSKNMEYFKFGNHYYFFIKELDKLTEQDKIKLL